MLKEKEIELGFMSEEDLRILALTRNRNFDYFFDDTLVDPDAQTEWYQKVTSDGTRQVFGIYTKMVSGTDGPGCFAGSIGYSSLDRKNQTVEYGNLLIREAFRGKGLAKEASKVLLDYLFTEVNVHRVYLEVFADNDNAVVLYEKLGFKREGVLRQAVFSRGEFRDVLIMGLLREDWKHE